MSDCTNCRHSAPTPSGVSRRHFLASSSALAITAVLAACGDGDDGYGTAPSNVNTTVRLSDFAALNSVGGIAVVAQGRTPIAVVRSAATTYRAFSLICPHQGTTVNISGAGFRCPNHGATFNASGAWTGGQQASRLAEFAVAADLTAGTLTITT